MKRLLLLAGFLTLVSGCNLNFNLGNGDAQRVYFKVDEVRKQCVNRVGIPPSLEDPKSFAESDLRVLKDKKTTDKKKAVAFGSLVFGFQSKELGKVASAGDMVDNVVSVFDNHVSNTTQSTGFGPADVQLAAKTIGVILRLAPSFASAATAPEPACPESSDLTNGNGFVLDFTGCAPGKGDGTLTVEGSDPYVKLLGHAIKYGGIPGNVTAATGDVVVTAANLKVEGDVSCDVDADGNCVGNRVVENYLLINGTFTLTGTDLTGAFKYHQEIDPSNNKKSWQLDRASLEGDLSVAVDLAVDRLDNQPDTAPVRDVVITGSLEATVDWNIVVGADSLDSALTNLVLKASAIKVQSFVDPIATVVFAGEISGSASWKESRLSDRYKGQGMVPAGVKDTEEQTLNLGLFKGAGTLTTSKGSVGLGASLAGTVRHTASMQWQGSGDFAREESTKIDLPCESALFSVESKKLGKADLNVKMYATISQTSRETHSGSQNKWIQKVTGDLIRVDASMGDLNASVVVPHIQQDSSENKDYDRGTTDSVDTLTIDKSYVAGKGGRDFYFETKPSLQEVSSATTRQSEGQILFKGLDEVAIEGANTPNGDMRVFLNGTEIK